jgi:hypothetical protein
MTQHLIRRAVGAGFAAALLLGAAACGDDDAPEGIDTEDPGVVDGMGGTDDEDSGYDTGDGLGGTDDEGQGGDEDSGVVDGMGGTDDQDSGYDTGEGLGGDDG